MSTELHLSAALEEAGVRRTPQRAWMPLVRLAERGGLDFVTLDLPSKPADPSSEPDQHCLGSTALLTGAARATSRIGLMSPVSTLPYRTPRAPAESMPGGGRTGLVLAPSRSGDAEQQEEHDPYPALAEHRRSDRTTRRNAAVNRFLESDPLRRTPPTGVPDSEGRENQRSRSEAHQLPPLAVLLDTHGPDAAWAWAASWADVVLLDADHPLAALSMGVALRREATAIGRRRRPRILLRLMVELGDGSAPMVNPRADTMCFTGSSEELAQVLSDWWAAGVCDGFHLLPTRPHVDLRAVVSGVVPRLRERGVVRTGYHGASLRGHLGLV